MVVVCVLGVYVCLGRSGVQVIIQESRVNKPFRLQVVDLSGAVRCARVVVSPPPPPLFPSLPLCVLT